MKYTIGGGISIDVLGNMVDQLQELATGERKYTVTIKKHKSSRSLAQNNLFHKWVDLMANEMGYTPEEMKHEIKRHCIGEHTYQTRKGEQRTMPKKTRELNVDQFTHLLEQTEILATKMGILLPRPEDYQLAMGRS